MFTSSTYKLPPNTPTKDKQMLNRNTVNKVILMGRVTGEPELRNPNGNSAFSFGLTTLEKIKSGKEVIMHEEHHKIRVTDPTISPDQFRVGTLLYIQGRLQTKTFTDKEGIKRYKTEVVALNIDHVEV